MTEDVALGLGSNLGDRHAHLAAAVRALPPAVRVRSVSSVWESPPAIVEDQPDFLNLVVAGETDLAPRELLRAVQAIERDAGRVRTFRAAPRTLDIDILFFGDRRIREPGLTVPHPGWRERAFVLAPLAEVDPARVDPESGRTVVEVWRAMRAGPESVRIFAPPPPAATVHDDPPPEERS